MKVAVVHDFHREAVPSGENTVVDAEVTALRRAGVDVRLLSVANDDLDARPLHRVRGALSVASGFGPSPLDQLGGFEPDVIHVHNLFPYFGTRWLRDAPCPVVVTVHSFRPVCASGYLFRDGEVCTLCPDGHRWSAVRHACYGGSRAATLPLAIAGRRGAGQTPLLRTAARVLVLSERSRALLAADGVAGDVLVRDWHFVPDSLVPDVPTAFASPTARSAEAPWLYVGRLSPEKGIGRLITAWPGGVPLIVVGDGPERAALVEAAAGRAITFTGALPRASVVDAMAGAIGLVFPSRWFETFGLVHIEALAVGVPTLAFAPNVVAEAVEAEGTGLVAAWGRLPEALLEAARRFPDLRERCREVFASRYTETTFVARRLELYAEVGRDRR